MRQEKYMTHWSYSNLYNGISGGRDERYTVKTSSIESIMDELKKYITTADLSNLHALLNADFVHPDEVERKTESSRHNEVWNYSNYQPLSWGYTPGYHLTEMSFGQRMHYQSYHAPKTLVSYQADTYIYQIHNVQPVLEVLVLNHRFKEIYDLACQQGNGSLEAILANMSHKSFVGADLSEFDLSNADVGDSDLSDVTLGIIKDADFTKSNLKTAKLSKEQLCTAKTYQEAQLPAGFRPFWTDETVSALDRKIIELQFAAKKYEKSNPFAYKKANELAGILEQMLDEPGAKYNDAFQEHFLTTLRSYDTHFTHAPLIQAVIASLALFIISAGVGYVAALTIRAYTTQNKGFLFFNQTAIEAKIEDIKEASSHILNELDEKSNSPFNSISGNLAS